MANKSDRRRVAQAKKKAAKEARMREPGGASKYAMRRTRPGIYTAQRQKMRHGDGWSAQAPPSGAACTMDTYGGGLTAFYLGHGETVACAPAQRPTPDRKMLPVFGDPALGYA